MASEPCQGHQITIAAIVVVAVAVVTILAVTAVIPVAIDDASISGAVSNHTVYGSWMTDDMRAEEDTPVHVCPDII